MYANKPKIDRSKQQKINQDWASYFPGFVLDRFGVLRKRVGPLLLSVGYQLARLSIDYEPATWILNLCNAEKGLYGCLSVRPKSRRSSITWEQHEKGLYKEAVEELKELSTLPLSSPITLNQIIESYNKEQGNRGFYLHELEDPALIAAWAGKVEWAKELALESLNYWEARIEERKKETGREPLAKPREWYQSLLQRLDPEKLRQKVEEEIIKHKLTNVPYEELIID